MMMHICHCYSLGTHMNRYFQSHLIFGKIPLNSLLNLEVQEYKYHVSWKIHHY
jgi:hypothetical protein